MPTESIRVKGYREYVRAANKAEKDTKRVVHERLRAVGAGVRDEAYRLFRPYDENTASHFRIRSRVGGVFIEQSLRKVTGDHPTYGALQMRRALEPALDSKAAEVERGMTQAMNELADILDGGRVHLAGL